MQLKPYIIPTEIQQLESGQHGHIMSGFIELIQRSRYDKESYTEAMTTLIHLEETANCPNIWKFDQKNVELILNSSVNRTFKFKYDVRVLLYFLYYYLMV